MVCASDVLVLIIAILSEPFFLNSSIPPFSPTTTANLPHNKVAREKLGLEDEARFTTQWHGNGKRQIPPHYWLEYMKCNNQRVMDLIDILHGSAMRDAEAHDSSFSSFYW